jgi:hypothetical protein
MNQRLTLNHTNQKKHLSEKYGVKYVTVPPPIQLFYICGMFWTSAHLDIIEIGFLDIE